MAWTNNDILTLAKAGFNAEQIAALAQLAAPAPAPAPAPASAPAPAPAPAGLGGDQFAQMMSAINDLTQSIQRSAIQQTQQPQPETPESILAAIIAPPEHK